MEILTDSIQDYLNIIYELTAEGEPASTTAVAARLGVAPASATAMVQRLAALEPALVVYHKYQGVKLTPAGQRAALEVIRRHRLLEAWLVQTLGYSWAEVHAEADKLEHAISGEFEERMAAALGYPARDPHGELIPTVDLVMPSDESISLAALQPEREAVVRRVQARDTDLLRYLEELGLVPGARVKVLAVSPYDQVMRLQILGRKEAAVLGPAITGRVFVEILHGGDEGT
jgi:DtxR family Mn-dependent transcriptional regulator